MSSTRSGAEFAARLRQFIRYSTGEGRGVYRCGAAGSLPAEEYGAPAGLHDREPCAPDSFDHLAGQLFTFQYAHNAPYRQFCESRGVTPHTLAHWSEIPAVPTSAFKELELSCLPASQRTAVFHSSGTTEQRPSRHFHNHESLALYEASLLPWFVRHMMPELEMAEGLAILTPSPLQAPRSSLAYMFDTVRRELGAPASAFFGAVGADDVWTLDSEAVVGALTRQSRAGRPVMLLGTAFLFVHLLDHLRSKRLCLALPPGSRVLETGGYKGRSRSLPKAELHSLITEFLGVPATHIVCEYGMSELSSQAYDRVVGEERRENGSSSLGHASRITPYFLFPPWARVQVVSPESGCEVGEGETGLIRVLDLANVFSVLAIQTEDLGLRRGDGFELLGRAVLAETRGCSLMAV